MNHNGNTHVYRVGVICSSPSIQMAAQYDALASHLKNVDFHLMFRRTTQGNAAWAPEKPSNCSSEVLPGLSTSWLPIRLQNCINKNIAPILNAHDFDALIVHGFYDSTAVLQAQRWAGKNNCPVFIRTDANLAGQQKRPLKFMVRKTLLRHLVRRTAGMLSIGTQNRKYYQALGASPDKIFPASWEIDYQMLDKFVEEAAEKRDEIRRQLGIPQDQMVIVSVGRLIKRKGFQNLIRATSHLKDHTKLQVHLIIAGDGPYQVRLQELVQELDAPVTFTGNLNRKQVIEILVAADVFALVSSSEPWGLVVNEAALCGLPLVLSEEVGAAADLCKPGVNGYVIPPEDQSSINDALKQVLSNTKARKQMGIESKIRLQEWRKHWPAWKGYKMALESAGLCIESHDEAGN